MTMQIKRKKDNRVVKCILHRVADIPGGVTVETATLGGKALFEGTPLGKWKSRCRLTPVGGKKLTPSSK